MKDENNLTRSEIVEINDIKPDFLSLKIGEVIPRLEIKLIRKVSNINRDDNLSGVDYKYFIETLDNKVLTVNSWILWNSIARVLKEARTIRTTLYLEHVDREKYKIRLA